MLHASGTLRIPLALASFVVACCYRPLRAARRFNDVSTSKNISYSRRFRASQASAIKAHRSAAQARLKRDEVERSTRSSPSSPPSGATETQRHKSKHHSVCQVGTCGRDGSVIAHCYESRVWAGVLCPFGGNRHGFHSNGHDRQSLNCIHQLSAKCVMRPHIELCRFFRSRECDHRLAES